MDVAGRVELGEDQLREERDDLIARLVYRQIKDNLEAPSETEKTGRHEGRQDGEGDETLNLAAERAIQAWTEQTSPVEHKPRTKPLR